MNQHAAVNELVWVLGGRGPSPQFWPADAPARAYLKKAEIIERHNIMIALHVDKHGHLIQPTLAELAEIYPCSKKEPP